MDPKKGPNYMQKAIEKASKLIQLLTKQNAQLKQQNINFQQQLDSYTNTQAQILKQQQEYINKLNNLQNDLSSKQAKIDNLMDQIRLLQQKINQKSAKNRQLHQKLSEFAGKNQELAKNLQKQKKRNSSLQSQNQYLIKTFVSHQEKQNQFQNYCSKAEQQFKREIIMVDRTKQAFARKCEQLKCQNINMSRQILLLTDKINSLALKQAVYAQSLSKLDENEKQIKRTNDALSYIIQSTLRIKAESGLYLKVQQIKNYINYRMQHIQNLIKPIIDFLAPKDHSINLKDTKNLQALNSVVSRLSSYLAELLK